MTRDDAIRTLITAWCKIPPEAKPPNVHLMLRPATTMDTIELSIYSEGRGKGTLLRAGWIALLGDMVPASLLVDRLVRLLTRWAAADDSCGLSDVDDFVIESPKLIILDDPAAEEECN